MSRHRPKPRGYWHDFENLRHELLTFVEQHGQSGVMPTYQVFRDHEAFDLIRALPFHGGTYAVAARLGLQMTATAKSLGYWQDFENVKRELLAFIQQHNLPLGHMPAYSVLLEAGRSDLLQGMKHHGAIAGVCQRLGWYPASNTKPRSYWLDFDHVQHELLAFIQSFGQPGIMPTKSDFQRHAHQALYRAFPLHGGIRAVAARLGLQMTATAKPLGYWQDFENVKRELLAFIRSSGQPGVMPTYTQFVAYHRTDLLAACRPHGGLLAVAQRLGLQRPGASKPLGYWADFANVESELRAFLQTQEDQTFLPTRRVLIQAGRHDLAYALYRHGGTTLVAARLGLRASQRQNARRWQSFSVVKRAILVFTRLHGLGKIMPTQRQLNQAGYGGLSKAILKYGGFPVVAQRLGLKSYRSSHQKAKKA